MRETKRSIHKTWWKCDKEQAHDDVCKTVEHLRKVNAPRREQDLHHMKLYGNLDVAGLGWRSRSSGWSRGRDGRMRYNMVASAVDTAASLIAQEKPKPLYLTTEGDFGMQRQARLRTRVLEGQLEDLDGFELGPEAAMDGFILGTGAVYGYLDPHTGEPRLERVLPLELQVDHADAIGRKPRCLYRSRLVAREVLLEQCDADMSAKLMESTGPSSTERADFWLGRDTTADQVVVHEAWHLPSGPDASDGRHVMCTNNVTLADDEYDEEDFPFAFFRWKKRQVGFFGVGVVEECRDPQWRINKLIKRAERAGDLCTTAWIIADSSVSVEHLTNAPGTVLKTGPQGENPAQVVAFNGTPTEIPQQINEIREQTFAQLGISQLAAAAQKPAGLDSGAALRAHDDINSRRHKMNIKGHERFYVDLFKLLSRLNVQASEASENGLELAARVQRGRAKMVKMVRWGDVDLPANKYRVQVFPVSALPSTPAGKWAAIQEWIQSGLVSRPFGQSLMDFPDLDAATRIELADLDVVMWDVEAMLDDGEVRTPEPFYKLDFVAEIARKAYLQAKINGAPEARLQLIRDYIKYADRLTSQSAAAQQPQQPAAAPAGPVPGVTPQAA